MPLVVEGVGKAVAHGDLRAIGFWMTVKGAVPVQPVSAHLCQLRGARPT